MNTFPNYLARIRTRNDKLFPHDRVLTSISMVVIYIVAVINLDVMHAFIAAMSIVVMLMHPDADAVCAHSHSIRHATGRKERGGKGNQE